MCCVANLEDLRRQYNQERENYKHHIQELKSRCEERKERVDDERRKFMDFKKHVALNALNSRSGRPIPPKVRDFIIIFFNVKYVPTLYCEHGWTTRSRELKCVTQGPQGDLLF